MNEKKAIVFFFFVVFCFSFFFFFYFLVVVPSTYVTAYVFLSPFCCFACVSVCSSSPFPSSCTRSPACLFCFARPMCVCVCIFSTFCCCCCCCFFSGASHSVSNAAAAALLARTWFLLFFCFNVVIRGGVFLHTFFCCCCCIEQNTHARAHGHGDTHTNGRLEKSARAPLVLGRQPAHTKLFCVFILLLCVIAIIMIGCCCYSLFSRDASSSYCNKDRERVRAHSHTLS